MEFGAKRKKNNLASKAMKLSWKKGITLKKAWKIVKGKDRGKKRKSRFGVLSDYDMMFTKSGLPRKPCDPNTEYRNPDSGRCIKIGSKTDLDLRARGIYPRGEGPPMLSRSISRSSAGSLMSDREIPSDFITRPLIFTPPRLGAEIPQAPGKNYEWYPGWQQWRKNCPKGYERNYETRRCRKIKRPSASGLSYAAAASADWVGYAGSSAGYDDMMYTKTGELRKPCNPVTEYRNPVTKRCVKKGGATDIGLRQGVYPPSMSRSASGLSSASSASAVGYDDTMYTKTGQLRKPCNPDTEYRNPVTKRCVKRGGPTDMLKRLSGDTPSMSSMSSMSSSAGSGYDMPSISRSSSLSGYTPPFLRSRASSLSSGPMEIDSLRGDLGEPLLSDYDYKSFEFGKKCRRRTCFGSCDSCRAR